MLYATPGHEAQFDRDDSAIQSSRGLGALVPHSANLRSGTAFHVLGGGGGAGDTSGTAVAPRVGNAPGFRPVGRNTSIFSAHGARRNRYQASSIAPRASTSGDEFDRPGVGLGFGFKNLLPPGGKLNRITPIPAKIRAAIPNFIKRPIRYYGAATQTIFAPLLTGAQQRRVFGLSAKESGVFMKAQQIMRPIDLAVVTFGASAAWQTGGFTLTSTATPAQQAAMIQEGFGSVGPTGSQALAANAAGRAAALGPVENIVTAGTSQAVTPVTNLVTASQLVTTPVSQAAMIASDFGTSAPVAASAASPSVLGGAASAVGKTALDTAAAVTLARALTPGQQNPGQGGYSPLSLGYQDPNAQPQAWGGGYPQGSYGGGSASGAASDQTPVEASLMTPGVLLGGAVVTAGLVMLIRRKRRAA